MIGSDRSTPDRRLASTLWGCLWLSLALAVLFPAFAAYGFAQSGWAAVQAAAVAGGVCWVGATAALLMSGLLRTPELAVAGLLGGMLFRMGLPLGVGLLLSTNGGPLVEAGVLGHLVGYYLLALILETLLSLRFVQPHAKAGKGAIAGASEVHGTETGNASESVG